MMSLFQANLLFKPLLEVIFARFVLAARQIDPGRPEFGAGAQKTETRNRYIRSLREKMWLNLRANALRLI
jgi:hypothetical protein